MSSMRETFCPILSRHSHIKEKKEPALCGELFLRFFTCSLGEVAARGWDGLGDLRKFSPDVWCHSTHCRQLLRRFSQSFIRRTLNFEAKPLATRCAQPLASIPRHSPRRKGRESLFVRKRLHTELKIDSRGSKSSQMESEYFQVLLLIFQHL